MRNNFILLISISSVISFFSFDKSNLDRINDLSCNCDPVRDSLALVEFKSSLDIWTKTGSQEPGNLRDDVLSFDELWPSYLSISEWIGIKLSEQGCVLELRLNTKSLSGEFPTNSLSQLNCLEVMDLGSAAKNSLWGVNGPINLGQNVLWGEFPEAIIELNNLKVLNLSNTELTGEIPKKLFTLPNLKELYITNSQIELNSLNIATKSPVQILDLSGINFTNNVIDINPNHFFCLKKLDLSGCSLIGEIPNTIGQLQNLEELELTGNSFSGSIPKNIGNLKQLKILRIVNNNISGELHESITQLENIEILDLARNEIGGSLPINLGTLQFLKYLDLSDNSFVGEVPNSIGQLIRLKHLNLSDNLFEGELPIAIGSLLSLTSLYIYDNRFTGSIPPTLGNLSQLQILWMFDNELSGQLPPELGMLSNCGEMALGNNQFTGAIPSQWSNLKSIFSIGLSSNQLSGQIPEFFLLRELYLANNNYEIDVFNNWNFFGLEEISLANNNLKGEIPDDVIFINSDGNRTTTINLEDNSISGTIPTAPFFSDFSFGKLELYLANNNLDSLSNLPLEVSQGIRSLSYNNLTIEDFLFNAPLIATTIYNPQKRFSQDTTIIFNPCEKPVVNLKIDKGVTNSQYTWYKNGDSIYVSNQNKLNLRTLYSSFEKYAGLYTVRITNPDVPSLILESGEIVIELDNEHPPLDTIQIDTTIWFGTSIKIDTITFDCANPNRLVEVPDSISGCITMYQVNLTCNNYQKIDFIVPTAFSPNNDCINETFLIPELYSNPLLKDNQLSIYYSNGKLAYQVKNYLNDWDGRNLNGEDLPIGTYYYQFEYENNQSLTGTITIIR